MSNVTYFDFEKPIYDLQDKIEELRRLSTETGINVEEEISQLARQAEQFRQNLYKNLHPAEKVQIARHPKRPNFLQIVQHISDNGLFYELHGNRYGSDDRAMIGGIIQLDGRPVMAIGTQKGSSMKENLLHNFGMATPEGYQKARRLFQHANKFGMPVLTIIDTPGAYPGMDGEQHGIGTAIAQNIQDMAMLRVPIVSLVTGEGCSGGALGIGVANHIYMLEHAVYTVISPEGCASILWRSAEFAKQAAECLKITAQDLQSFGMIEGIIEEPLGGAHYDAERTMDDIRQTLTSAFSDLANVGPQDLVHQRYEKFRKMGAFEEAQLSSSV